MTNKVRTAFANMGWMMISQIIASVCAFVWTIVTAWYLGPSDYGIFGSAVSFAALFGIIIDFGLPTYLVRAISTDMENEHKYLDNAISVKLFLSILYIIVVFFALIILGWNSKLITITLLISFENLIKSYHAILFSSFQAHEKMKYQAITNTILNVLTLAFIAIVIFTDFALMGIAFAYIIANENYEIAKVPYALNDGWVFEKYCRQTLGIPDKNIHLYEDATAGNIIACIENLKETARAYEGDASIIFYYAGHAFPDEEEHSAYLLPIDGNSQNIATAYSLKKLYKEFNSVPVKQLICFIDACFSGTTRTDEMLIAGRGVAVKVKDDVPQGNAVVFTSATGAETAHSYEEKGHGMYTYYLLQKLQETQGDVTLGELTNYVRKMVRRKSVVVNEKMQTPCVIPSASLGTEWQSWKLK